LIGAGIPIAVDSVPEDRWQFNGELAQPDVERRLRRTAALLTRGQMLRPAPGGDGDEVIDPFD
jgi:hypothetical protein